MAKDGQKGLISILMTFLKNPLLISKRFFIQISIVSKISNDTAILGQRNFDKFQLLLIEIPGKSPGLSRPSRSDFSFKLFFKSRKFAIHRNRSLSATGI